MSLHAGMLASLTAEHVLFRTMVPMGRVMALASLMPCEDPEASTTASNACSACTPGHEAGNTTTAQPCIWRQSMCHHALLFRTRVPMDHVMVLASLMACENPEAYTTASNALNESAKPSGLSLQP